MKPLPKAPYIGITGFREASEVIELTNFFQKHRPKNVQRVFHVGAMTSPAMWHGIDSQFKEVFPAPEKLRSIFCDGKNYNCLHYADYRTREGFGDDLYHAIALSGMYLDAVQLDMTWPDPGVIAHAVHTSRKPLEVILQLGKAALMEYQYEPASIATALVDYGQVIHRVLLDASMGHGIRMKPDLLIEIAQAIRKRLPDIRLVFAGGLGSDTLHLLTPILIEYPDASWDAQLRLQQGHDMQKPLNLKECELYLEQSFEVCAG